MKLLLVLIASTSILFFTNLGFALEKSVNIFVSHKSGGGMATMQQAIADGLVQKGWDVNFTILGNCGAGKEKLKSSNRLNLVGYEDSWIKNTDHTCFVEVNENNFVSNIYQHYYWLCGPKNFLDFKFEKGQTYKIGINRGSPDIELLKNLAKKIGITFTFVEYKNSGAIKQAFHAREIDLTYSSNGPSFMDNNEAVCLFSTSFTELFNVHSIKSMIDSDYTGSIFTGMFLINSKSTPEYSQLENDIQEIKKSNNFLTIANNRFYTIFSDGMDQELVQLKNSIK